MMYFYYLILIVLWREAIVISEFSEIQSSDNDNLWPSETTFLSAEDILIQEREMEVAWFYELFDAQNRPEQILLKRHLLFGNKNDKQGVDWVVSLDELETGTLALILRTSLPVPNSCGKKITEDEMARYVVLPKYLSSNSMEYEVRCFKIGKCHTQSYHITKGNASSDSEKNVQLEFPCIKDFENQQSTSIQRDLNIVVKELEQWTSNTNAVQPGSHLRLFPESNATATVPMIGNTINGTTTSILDDEIANNNTTTYEDSPISSLENITNSIKSKEINVPESKMLNSDWDPNIVSKRLLDKKEKEKQLETKSSKMNDTDPYHKDRKDNKATR